MSDEIQTVTCPNCGAARPASLSVCSNCGYGQSMPSLVCPHCHTPSPPGSKVCANCYRPLRRPRRTWVWVILFIVIGIPGACMGTCLIAFAGVYDPLFVALGLLGLLVFVGLAAMLIRSTNR